MRTIGRPVDNRGRVADAPPIDNMALPFGTPPLEGAVAGGVPEWADHNPRTCQACRELRDWLRGRML